ncbi:spore germination protein [Paenibacillus melissococcoides]|uniref:Spore germination protein n=2 Tax=Paenibacillus TaxID=44249 RepID=A0ABN8U5H8_9BACL|nr:MULTISPECIES: spore germination protein [Paenibacillus]MEB9895304.1 spore germination protein [Bacillus cereus]CAH8244982.1 spore germination protein [Paenibacillus melissococcoides]CAH8709555.1 spore germination protein [Paenibacillus melissococcoides]CAH8710282.1 spore germination protein [Paenibacillus melissococcoides]GIO78334.1 putative membrane protein YndD [Paenibacillus dendritiformis]
MWNVIVSYFPKWDVWLQAVMGLCVPYGVSLALSKNKQPNQEKSAQEGGVVAQPSDFTGNLQADITLIQNKFNHQSDVSLRTFCLGKTSQQAAVFFISSISDKKLIETHILKSLMGELPQIEGGADAAKPPYSKPFILQHALTVSKVKEADTLGEVASELMLGNTVLLIDQCPGALILSTRKEITRNIQEPPSEALVRGPRLGFNESIDENTALLRQHGKNENLVIARISVGKRVKRELLLTYIADIANPSLVREVQARIGRLNLDDILESGYIEQLMEDNFLSPFPQVQSTERVDRVLGALLEGRVALIMDGTPFALIVPVTFNMLLQSPEDYYDRWIPGTLLRILRYFAAFISLFGPSLYISFISFHQGLIPTKLALSIAQSRAGVPFPSLIEVLIMEVSLEILREAGLRLPKPIGQTIGIVGGLVIGEAAVQAGIVSPIMIIVVAITAISSFAIPQYNAGIALRMLRFAAMIFAAIFGLYGLVLFFLAICSHLAKLKSFGTPYLSPAAPYRFRDWKDFLVRGPLRRMNRRPKMLNVQNQIRHKQQEE